MKFRAFRFVTVDGREAVELGVVIETERGVTSGIWSYPLRTIPAGLDCVLPKVSLALLRDQGTETRLGAERAGRSVRAAGK